MEIEKLTKDIRQRAFENEYAKANPDVDLDELSEVLGKLKGIANRQIGVIELDHTLEIDDLRVGEQFRRHLGQRAHDRHVLRHGFAYAGALHFDSHILTGDERGTMHLGQRCRTQRLGVDAREDLLDGPAVLLGERIHHGLVRHRVGVGA